MSVSFVSRKEAKNLKAPGDNSIVSALKRGQHSRRLRDEQRAKYQQYKPNENLGKFVGDKGLDDINGTESGITHLKIVDNNGNANPLLNNEFVIGDRAFKADENGLIRLLDTDVIDEVLEQSIAEEEYLNGIISLMLTDKSGRVAKWALGPVAYGQLQAQGAGVEQITTFHGASAEFSQGLHKLREATRKNLPVLDQDKMQKYIDRIKGSAHSKKAVDAAVRGVGTS